jgi:hypothetical protein
MKHSCLNMQFPICQHAHNHIPNINENNFDKDDTSITGNPASTGR